MHALGLEFGSAAQLSKRPGSVWNCLWGNALKRSPGIIRKSRVSYPGPGFLSSATWPSLPKKHYNGLKQITSFLKPVKLFKIKTYTLPNLTQTLQSPTYRINANTLPDLSYHTRQTCRLDSRQSSSTC